MFLPNGRDLVQAWQTHGQGVGVIVGVVAPVVGVESVGRGRVVLVAVAMPIIH
jgi:hypothetical protein